MGIISGQIIEHFTELAHPGFQADTCINSRQRRITCSACMKICQEKVFSSMPDGKPDWLRCINCDLCVSACPADALSSHPDTRSSYLDGRDLHKTVIIGCDFETRPCTLKVSCVASLSWELIAFFALHTKVVFYLNACPNCARTDA